MLYVILSAIYVQDALKIMNKVFIDRRLFYTIYFS